MKHETHLQALTLVARGDDGVVVAICSTSFTRAAVRIHTGTEVRLGFSC